MSKKVIIFDLDDTLTLERDYIKSGFRVVASHLEKKLKKSKKEIYGKMWELFETDSNMLFNRLLDDYGMQYFKEDILVLIDIYRSHKPTIELFPDAKEILKYLHENGYRMGMITDGYSITQRRKLEVLGIEKYFEQIIVTDELGREFWKPSEIPYRLMKEKMVVEFKEMIYIGDNPKKDFISAKKLGMKTIEIIRENGVYKNLKLAKEYDSEIKIESLKSLVEIIHE